ncbi:hypothetical protein [Streptomyces xanthophaeus]
MPGEQGAGPGADDWAGELIGWLDGHERVEHRLRAALSEMSSHRWEIANRMSDALKASAQGLSVEAAAASAGLSERLLREWMAKDPAFAHAMTAARALAASRGLHSGNGPTPAMVHLVLRTVRQGAPWPYAAKLAGFSVRGFNRLRREVPAVGALVTAAQRARPSARGGTARARTSGSGSGSGSRSGSRPATGSAQGSAGSVRAEPSAGYRLVHLDDPLLSPGTAGHPPPGPRQEAARRWGATP